MVEARGLFQDQEKFVIMGKLFMMCNKLPPVTSMDRGTWRRIRVVEFISRFCDEPNPKKPYEFHIDRELPNKLEDCREVFMYMLIQIYQNSCKKH